jgi:hypothetical protein
MISFDDGRARLGLARHPQSESLILNHPEGATASGRSSSVATDQKTSTLDRANDPADSPIENELPTYRAISARAILSAICGGLAVCSFADPTFYAFSFLAVALGLWAHRAIRRYPDVLTGHGLANVGIALGIMFGLASFTLSSVQKFLWTRQAEQFGRKYAEVLKSPNLGDVLWYNALPDARKGRTGAQILEQAQTSKSKQQMMMDQKMGPMAELTTLRNRLAATNDEQVHFLRIEDVGEDSIHGAGSQIYALALFEVEGPGNKDFPEKHQFAMAVLKGRSLGRSYEWWAETIKFPYVPKTYVAPATPVGDSHNHAH